MRSFTLLISALLLAACAPSSEMVQTAIAGTQSQWTAIPTVDVTAIFESAEAQVWLDVEATVDAFGREVVRQTATAAAAGPTKTPAPTIDLTTRNRGDGFYLVGPEIAPGVWRSTSTADGCYWNISTRTGEIIENYFGQGGGTAYVPASAYQVELDGCGEWEYQGP